MPSGTTPHYIQCEPSNQHVEIPTLSPYFFFISFNCFLRLASRSALVLTLTAVAKRQQMILIDGWNKLD